MYSRAEYLTRFPVEFAMHRRARSPLALPPGVWMLSGFSGEAAALGALAYG